MNQKAWSEVKRLRFSYLQPIQDFVVMEFDAKPVLSPNKPVAINSENFCDIPFGVSSSIILFNPISQTKK